MRRLNVPALVKTDRGRRGGGEVGGGAFRVSVGRCDAEARRGSAVCRWGGGEEKAGRKRASFCYCVEEGEKDGGIISVAYA